MTVEEMKRYGARVGAKDDTRVLRCLMILISQIEYGTSSSSSFPREDGNARTNLPLVFDPFLSFFTLMFFFIL